MRHHQVRSLCTCLPIKYYRGYTPKVDCRLAFVDNTIPHLTNSFTLLFINNIKWPKQNSWTSITYPNVLPKPNFLSIAHNLFHAHMGSLCSPEHPFPKRGCPNFWTTKDIRILGFILSVDTGFGHVSFDTRLELMGCRSADGAMVTSLQGSCR